MNMEVNLQVLLEKILRHKFLFLISVSVCLVIAIAYIKLATPAYEVGTSILIDPLGTSRKLGESEYMQGGVGLIDPEKNIFNEMGILKSFGLIEETVSELKFDVSYYIRNGYKEQEAYGYFPFEVKPDYTKPQIFGVPFYIQLLSDSTYQLSTEAKSFTVSNPSNGTVREVENSFTFSKVFVMGKPVEHDYFHFTVTAPPYPVVRREFQDSELLFKIHRMQDVANSYLDKLELNQTDIQASILELRTQGAVPAKEIDFLNRLTANYIEGQLAEREEIARSKEAFIEQQLNNIADSLSRAERSLEAFRRNTRAVDLGQTGAIALDQVQNLKSQQAQVQLNITYYQSQLQTLVDSASIDKIIAPSVVGIDDPLLNETLLELKRLYSEKARLKLYKGAQSMDLELINQQIRNSSNSLQANLRNLIHSSQLSLADINSRLAGQEGVLSTLPSSEKQLLNYQRKSGMYETLFNYLSQELAKTGIAKAEEMPDTKVLDEARIMGDGPVSPQKKLILALACIVGLILPLAWIILYDSIDETIQDVTELEARANVPVLASIATDNSNSIFSVSELSEWRVEESFRDLTASIQFLVPDKTKNVIGITSTIPGEGKTFCSVNLGIHFAKAGKKVLLIDADFRKPSIMEEVANTRKKDFSAFLENDRLKVSSIIHTHPEISNLHFVVTRQQEKNPQLLLSSPRFAELLDLLAEQYDYIIIDSPAIGLVSDYLLISKHIHINLFLTRRKISKISFLRNLEKLKKSGQLENIYLLFNGAIGKSFKYGYSHYEYNGNGNLNGKARFKSIKNFLNSF